MQKEPFSDLAFVTITVTNVLWAAAWILGRKYGWITKYIISLTFLWQIIMRFYIQYMADRGQEDVKKDMRVEFIVATTLYVTYQVLAFNFMY